MATHNFGTIVIPLWGGSFKSELVPSTQQAAIVGTVVVVVGVLVVESPVGDAYQHILACVGAGESESLLHTVGTGVDTCAVHGGDYFLRYAVLQDIG